MEEGVSGSLACGLKRRLISAREQGRKRNKFRRHFRRDDRIPSSNLTRMHRFRANVNQFLACEKDIVFGVLVYRRLNSPPEKRISLTESAFEKFMGVSEDTIKHQKAKEEIEHPSINSPEEVTLLM